MRRFSVVAAVALLVLVLVGSACTSTSSGGEAGSGGGEAAAGAGASFDVSLTDQLKIEPAMIDAPSNTPLTFNVTNTGATQHSFAIEVGDQTLRNRHSWTVAAPRPSRCRRWRRATTRRCAPFPGTPRPV